MIYEIATGSTSHRHGICDSNDLNTWIWEEGEDKSLFTSVYCFHPNDRQNMEMKKASEWIELQRYIEWVPIDIDKQDNTDERTLQIARSILESVMNDGLGLKAHNLKCYFSGRGYHILIHTDCFGFNNLVPNYDNPDKHYYDLPYVVKETIKALPGIDGLFDPSLYQRNGLIRATHTKHQKSGLYKIPLSIGELMTWTPEQIMELAKVRRADFQWEDEYFGDGELAEYVKTDIPPIRVYAKLREPINEEACIYKMFKDGPIEGTRHNVILRLVSHLRKSGIPSGNAKGIMLDWNNGNQDDHVIMEMVEKGYERGYVYGCTDSLRKSMCSIRCKHYVNKDIVETPKTFSEVFQNAMNTNFLEEYLNGIDLAKMLGINMGDSDFVITRGEIISILGITKAGKSTLMKNIALGIDFMNPNRIYSEYLRKSVYYTGEQEPELFLLYCCMILENCDKRYAFRNHKALLAKWKPAIEHIVPLKTSGKLAGIKQAIIDNEAQQIFLDTLDHFVDKSRGTAGIEDAMLFLQDIAADTGVIIWLVSQVGRLDSRDNNVNLFSGKGSGSIENQSRKVIGLSLTDIGENVKNLKFLANTYGGSGQETQLQIYSSARMRSLA